VYWKGCASPLDPVPFDTVLKKHGDISCGASSPNGCFVSAQIQYWWQSAYLSAILEFDPVMVSYRLDQAARIIEERMKLPLEPGSQEHQAIQDARSGIAMLKATITERAD
jgi:hypothetical protein